MAPRKTRSSLIAAALATAIVALGAPSAGAETRTVRIAKQFGISYLPLTVMEEKKLLDTALQKMDTPQHQNVGPLLHDRINVKLCMVHLPAVNTPQFDWARNKMGQKAQPVPPMYGFCPVSSS